GISGYVSNSSSSKSADIFGGKAVFNVNSNDKVSTLIIGGIVASTQGYAKIENSISWIFSEDGITAKNMVLFGGIVGNSIGNLIYIDNCFAYIESSNAISHEGLTISCKNITAGGFIGSINSNAIVIDIMNSSASGAIWPKYDGADGRLILGGMIASIENVDFSKSIGNNVYKTQIVNSFTTVALETSQYKVNNNDKTILDSQTSSFVVSSIIGLVGANCAGKIYIKDCYYSSDYTLCLEEKTNIFDGAVINLLPQSMLDKNQKDYFFKDGWTSKDFGLPYRTDLVEGMTSMIYGNSSLFKLFTTSGTSLKPKVIDKEYIEAKMSGELFEDSYYNYYVFDWVVDWNNLEPEYISKLLTGDLNGFVLGNGLEISVKESLDNILTNSVVSNLKISIIDVENVLNEKALIIKNSGTIFNVYLDYYLVDDEVSFTSASAGLVKRNNGNILYCVNSGTIEITGANFAGMVYTNSGYIANSAYIGSVVSEAGSNVAGLVIENNGSIYNSYSAGVVAKGQSTFVKSNSAVIRNSYYDIYANQEFANIVDTGKGTTYLKAVSTYQLQTKVSGLKGKWDIYPLNAKQAKTGEDGLELKDKDGNIIYKTHTEFYNYGYPIYSIHQTYYDTTFDNDTVKTYIYKGLFTGSGTETAPYQIPNLGVLESINSYNNTANLYFMIINDIDFNKNNKNNSNATNLGFAKDWFGVGEVGNSSEWVKEGKNNAFSGTIYSGLRNGEFEEYSRVIANITGKSGLINKMSSDAEIHNLILSGSEIKNNSGNVGLIANSFVKSTNSDQRDLENGNVYNINIIDGIEFNLAGTNVGGLIGSVEYEANINNIALDSAIINVMASNAGGLVGVINGESITGNIIFTNIISNFTISGKSTSLGSFIGLANKSAVFTEITVGSQVVGINKDSDEEGADINVSEAETVGGFVGTIDQNSEITMINVKIAEEGDEAGVTVGGKSAVGGLVGNLFGTLTLESKFEINKFNLDIFTNSNINDSYAGGLIGKLGVNTETESVIGLLNIKLGENEEVGETYEATISIGENEKSLPSYSGGVVGGFFNGEIYTNSLLNLEISNLKATKYAGGVASIMKAGNFCGINLNFVEASKSGAENITDNLIAPVFGGIVGQMLGGEIGKIEETNNATKEELLLVKVEGSLKVANALVLASCVGEYQGGIIKNFETDLSNVSSLKNDDLDVKFNPTNKGVSALIAVSLADVVVLGNVKISNSLIVEGGNDVENIGAFFGFTSSSTIQTLKDSSLEIDKVNVNGIKNVGGFAGQFAGTTSLNLTVSEEGETNTVKEYLAGKEFAVIGIPSDDILNIGNMENIGGLFGYYNSNSEMLFNVNGEDEPSQFVNANTVLVDAFTNNQSKNSEKFNLSESTNYSITNIGGVVGNTASTLVGGLNQANIGTGYAESYYNALFEDFKNNKNKTILNAKNVGGVVGTISSDRALIKIQNAENSKDDEFIIVGYQNVGGIIGNLKPINQEKYQLLNVLNHGLVYGYNNVGGIIGSANANIEAISIKNPDGGENNLTIENQGNVFGFSNVGGFAGELKEVSSNLGAMMLEAEVEGVINVGGVVGYTNTNLIIYGNTVDITGDYSGVVRGNSNVGGIVGKSEYVSGNGYVQSEETLKISLFNSNNIIIEVQEYKYGKNKVDSKDAYYMPTSVGGVAGYAKTISLSGNFGGTIKNSENELMATSSSLANYIISKNSNSFASLVNSDKRDIDSTQSGIGGMVGTFEEYVTENTSIESATLKFNINVSNGINVGGLFGYWYAEIENVVTDDGVIKNAITLPLAKVGGIDESNRIYVAGGVNIGGIAGKITTNSGAIATSLDLTYCNFELDYLTLQEGKVFKNGEEQSSAIFGENVGGLFGSTDVALSNIVIENNNKNLGNLRINNTEGDNFGVIVGKTSSDITGVSINSAVLKYSETGNNFGTIFTHPTNFNYGAIAGMVDVKSEKIEIHGVHHGAFTINTLRNFNYDISNKDLAVDHDMSQILLTGYGTNNAEISISPSNEKINNNPSIYDSSKPETITGWHQEYTMFNVIKLASTNEDNEIVSSLPIYNSENISRVQQDVDRTILFTIYGDLLYSRVGIAKLYNNLSSEGVPTGGHETFIKD
ncbi:MAG: hypothetical protein IJX26_02475, partial [Clostridia bacterium]|nr:hypothetical protein [Clostridia bacterium]